jgi:hypothetical protein
VFSELSNSQGVLMKCGIEQISEPDRIEKYCITFTMALTQAHDQSAQADPTALVTWNGAMTSMVRGKGGKPRLPQWQTGNTANSTAKSYQLEMMPVWVLKL